MCKYGKVTTGHVVWQIDDYLAKFEHNPIGQNLDTMKYFFWDETWSDTVGAYDTVIEAFVALVKYCKELEEDIKL